MNHPSCLSIGSPARPPVPVLPPIAHPVSFSASAMRLALPRRTVLIAAAINFFAVASSIMRVAARQSV